MTQPKPTPQDQPKAANNTNIRGETLPLEDLLDFATIDPADIESASEWWDNNASPDWVGALDVEPTEENVIDDSR
jgi:hypothetical protein